MDTQVSSRVWKAPIQLKIGGAGETRGHTNPLSRPSFGQTMPQTSYTLPGHEARPNRGDEVPGYAEILRVAAFDRKKGGLGASPSGNWARRAEATKALRTRQDDEAPR